MKKIIIIVLAVITFSCTDSDNVIYDVFDGLEHGAVIRTLNRGSQNFNLFDLSSSWDITVETQDEEFGNLLSQMIVHVGYIDNKDDGTDNNRAEVVLRTIEASEFTTSANGLPSIKLDYTLSDVLTALALSPGQYNGGDIFAIRLELLLTDGRSFSAADGSGSLQGSYFQSPYVYQAGMLCIPITPVTGDYQIDMQDSWGDGWNGAAIRVIVDGVPTDYTVSGAQGSANSETASIPSGTATLVFEFISGDWDGEVTFQIYTPSGALGADLGPNPVPGEIALFLCDE
ncbi:hypothetical protein JYT89_03535 [Flavobacteriaceae bacterium AH-315-B10]|nr:hypothetical protein [Flavobacteriaceae bacterium AH-315-B10]